MNLDSPGLIYYVLDATRLTQRVKIGTTTNLDQRMKALHRQTASRQDPIVLAVEAGGIAREHALHAQFSRFRLTGEWFRYEAELRDYIAGLDHPVAYLSDREELWHLAGGWNVVPFTTATGMAAEDDLVEAAASDLPEMVF